jgi:hypothetical protein
MKQPPPSLSQEEMRQIVGYIWARQYFRGNGNAERGHKVFAEKKLRRVPQRPVERRPQAGPGQGRVFGHHLVAALWEHGPRMLDLMKPEEARLAAVHGAADVGFDRVSEFAVTLTGLGGGVVVTPALTLLMGVDLRYAIGASLVSVIATSSGAAAAYVREGYSNIRVGMFLEVATTIGAVVGAFLTGRGSGRGASDDVRRWCCSTRRGSL